MIGKIIILALVVGFVYFFFFKKPKKKEESEVQSLVQCSVCGTYFSKNDGIVKNKVFYCSKECKERG